MKINVFQKLDPLIIFLKKYIFLGINLINKYIKLTFMIGFVEFNFFTYIFTFYLKNKHFPSFLNSESGLVPFSD